MRKAIVLVLAALFAVSSVSFAEAAKKKSKKAKAKPAAAQSNPNEPGMRLVANGVSQIFVPIQSLAKPAKK